MNGLDLTVRREFIETVIGAYQDAAPGERTVFVSTHLISEFEGLIDEFTIVDAGRALLTMGADTARARYRRLLVRVATDETTPELGAARLVRRRGRELEVLADEQAEDVVGRLRAAGVESIRSEPLTLEELFVSTLQQRSAAA